MKIRKNLGCVVLQDWFVQYRDPENLYTPPELSSRVLSGKAYGHPKFMDGDGVITSQIIGIKGRRVQTVGGSTYLLGRIQGEYREWLRAQGMSYHPRMPVSIKERL